MIPPEEAIEADRIDTLTYLARAALEPSVIRQVTQSLLGHWEYPLPFRSCCETGACDARAED